MLMTLLLLQIRKKQQKSSKALLLNFLKSLNAARNGEGMLDHYVHFIRTPLILSSYNLL